MLRLFDYCVSVTHDRFASDSDANRSCVTPPYQESLGPKKSAPIYQNFWNFGQNLAEKSSMIFQSTWQTNTASNLVELRKKIISENYSVDSFDSSKNLFPDTSIPSGVSIITGPQAKSVKHPVLDGYYISDEKSFSILKKITHRGKFNFHSENKYMVIVGESNGASLLNNRIISKPVIVTDITKSPYANPQILYSSDTRNDCVNAQRFWSTKFVRFAIKQLKRGHHQPIKVFGFVPDVDQTKFTTDKELNDKFNLTQEEIKYIDENISHF